MIFPGDAWNLFINYLKEQVAGDHFRCPNRVEVNPVPCSYVVNCWIYHPRYRRLDGYGAVYHI